MNVRESTGDTFDSIMSKDVTEVLTLATYLKEKIEIVKSRNNGSTNV